MKVFLYLSFMALAVIDLYGQTPVYAVGEKVSFHSTALDEERSLAIYTPENYQTSSEKYPVLYVLDGEWNFHYVSGLVSQLSSSGAIPQMIVVGIINTHRSRDLTPPGKNDNPKRFGGAKRFLAYLLDEVKPYLEKQYRTQPFSVLAGHSFGGLFSIYALMERPGTFQSYISLSPSLGRNDEQQVRIAETFFSRDNDLPKALFLAVGNEGGYTFLSSKKLATRLEKVKSERFRWKFRHFEKSDHVAVKTRGFLEGLEFVFEGINPENIPALDDIFLIEQHFEHLSQRFGYTFLVPEFYYQKYVKEQLGEREIDYALFILDKYKEKYPNSPHMLLAYADAYLLKGDFKSAREFYKKIIDLDPENERLNNLLESLKN